MAPRLPLFGGTWPFGQLRREEQTAGCRIAISTAERPRCRRRVALGLTGHPTCQPLSVAVRERRRSNLVEPALSEEAERIPAGAILVRVVCRE
jgi:hypothetical protein